MKPIFYGIGYVAFLMWIWITAPAAYELGLIRAFGTFIIILTILNILLYMSEHKKVTKK